MYRIFLLVLSAIYMIQCGPSHKVMSNVNEFPDELVHFIPYKNNPVFTGTGTATWDNQIRERGWIFKEDNIYHLWYTGYTNIDSIKYLGYATSPDGFTWTR